MYCCEIRYFYSEHVVTILFSLFFFFFSVFEFSILNSPPFLVVGFAEEDEVDEDDEVGEGVGQVQLREKPEGSCSCIIGLVQVDVLGQKFGCASGDDDSGDAEVVAPHVAVFEAVALHAESASSCSVRAVGVDGEYLRW